MKLSQGITSNHLFGENHHHLLLRLHTTPLSQQSWWDFFFLFLTSPTFQVGKLPIIQRWLGDHSIVNQEADFHLHPAQRIEVKGKAGMESLRSAWLTSFALASGTPYTRSAWATAVKQWERTNSHGSKNASSSYNESVQIIPGCRGDSKWSSSREQKWFNQRVCQPSTSCTLQVSMWFFPWAHGPNPRK